MEERETLEQLTGEKIRWPQAEDIAFQRAGNWFNSAHISVDVDERLYFMKEGYKTGADLMVEHAQRSRGDRNRLVYAIIFNYRQYIELSFKYFISSYGPRVGVEENWKTHDLGELWNTLKIILNLYGIENSDEGVIAVENIAAQFAKVDPSSYFYRYPVDTRGRPIPIANTELDLEVLKDVIDGVEGFFTGCDGYLDAHLQSWNEAYDY